MLYFCCQSSDKCRKACYIRHCMCVVSEKKKIQFFLLTQMMLCVMMFCNFPHFAGSHFRWSIKWIVDTLLVFHCYVVGKLTPEEK